MSYIVFAWMASFLFGIEVIIGKLSTKYAVANPWLFNIIWSAFLFLFTVPFALYYKAGFPDHWVNLTIAGFCSALFGILYIWMMGILDVSVLIPLFNFRIAFTALLSMFLLNEYLTSTQYVYVGIMFISGLFVSTDEQVTLRSFFRWPIGVTMGSMVVLALMGIYLNKALAENKFWDVTLWMTILTLAFQLPTLFFSLKDVKNLQIRNTWGIAAMALAGAFASFFVNVAYGQNVSITSAILSVPFSMIMAIVISFIYPKLLENHTLQVYGIRLTAALVMIWCAIRLSV